MKRIIIVTVLALGIIFLGACNTPEEVAVIQEEAIDLTAVVRTVYAQITETARIAALSATPTASETPQPTNTATPPPPTLTLTETLTETPIVTPTEAPTATPTSGLPCNRANLETKSIADGAVIFINREFTQTFRLKNTGNCIWDRNYELRFIEGDLLNAGASIVMVPEGTVPTWGYANVDVLMRAPAEPGTYKGYWMIKAANGQIFGVGPSGGNWFWVEIKVVDPNR
ncbi:MAG: hypothetical protein FJ010_09745 [Chloroflexi bacterium]|nr:hypothetical protein [Chloroflexota bacterium]